MRKALALHSDGTIKRQVVTESKKKARPKPNLSLNPRRNSRPTDNTMKNLHMWLGATILLLSSPVVTGCDQDPTTEATMEEGIPLAQAASRQPIAVSGSGVHYFSGAIVHSQEQTEDGMIQQSTDIIELTGDLEGYVLYHPTSVFDNDSGTLVNTGTQIFSGTVAGSGPVILHDDTFRFEVDLNTGATTGEVHLGRSRDAPHLGGWYECDLVVVGTGVTPEGDNLSNYSGECIPRGNVN
jgi:hypothetical protein